MMTEFKPVEITIHKNLALKPDGKHYLKTEGWQRLKLYSIEELNKAITTYCYSPICYSKDERKGIYFDHCELAILDFDEGLSIPKVNDICQANAWFYIVAPTVNHGVWKNGKEPCDRFRLILRFNEKICNNEQYKYNIKQLIEKYNSDTQCKDAARYFEPSKNINYFEFGYYLDVLQIPEGYNEHKPLVDKYGIEQSRYDLIRYYKYGKLPSNIEGFLNQGIVFGKDRHTCFYVVGLTFARLKLSLITAIGRVLDSPFDRKRKDGTTINNAEIERTVSDGYKRGCP